LYKSGIIALIVCTGRCISVVYDIYYFKCFFVRKPIRKSKIKNSFLNGVAVKSSVVINMLEKPYGFFGV
jgi:hypothetical protein